MEMRKEVCMIRKIFITTQFEHTHNYPSATEEVIFLRYMHRHIFKVRVEIEVFNDERDLEFIIVKRKIDKFISSNIQLKDDNSSCETMAEKIYTYLKNTIALNRKVVVEVNEDGENGAILGDIL
jgi:6-pyruvoyl-tetrahydropterin synthase